MQLSQSQMSSVLFKGIFLNLLVLNGYFHKYIYTSFFKLSTAVNTIVHDFLIINFSIQMSLRLNFGLFVFLKFYSILHDIYLYSANVII